MEIISRLMHSMASAAAKSRSSGTSASRAPEEPISCGHVWPVNAVNAWDTRCLRAARRGAAAVNSCEQL